MFYSHKNGKLNGALCSHVDDFLHAGDKTFEKITAKLQKKVHGRES